MMDILMTWSNHTPSRNLAQAGEVCCDHHWYNAGRNTRRTSANHTTRRIPSVGFALGNDDPVCMKYYFFSFTLTFSFNCYYFTGVPKYNISSFYYQFICTYK